MSIGGGEASETAAAATTPDGRTGKKRRKGKKRGPRPTAGGAGRGDDAVAWWLAWSPLGCTAHSTTPHEDDDTLRAVYYLRGIKQAHGNVGVHAFVAPDAHVHFPFLLLTTSPLRVH